ncbi:MAG: hypothetical protein A2Z25_06100 [Planctomycetes bacterium RBG_16_55_9]|nr:MAG: hypothetical protein A2Z25_06100 [Planctomycetes bacterium RBG_16_55_9]
MPLVNSIYTTSKKPNRICFVAHFAYGAMAGGDGGHIGGGERQTSLMAKWFAGRGYSVSVITWDEGQEDGVEIDGVRVFKMCRKDAGIKGLRFFWPKWTRLVGAMKRADADVYYQNCGEYVTGQVAIWCRRHGRKFVYSVAIDTDCDSRLPQMHKRRERFLYRYGLRYAHKVIVQTRKQQEMLWTHFNRDSIVIPMPCQGPTDAEYADCQHRRNGSGRVLWIGRICEQKRPDRLLDLAKSRPHLQFDFVGPADGTDYARSVCQRAGTMANVTVHGPARRESVPGFYQKAKVLCCTSDFEGFPNTFLEAWSYGLPIVSTFDPDHLIAEKGLGRVGANVDGLAAGIDALIESPDRWRSASRAARTYYAEHHAPDKTMELFERLFCDAVSVSDGNGEEL